VVFGETLVLEKLTLPPIRGAPLAWMKRMVREVARKHLAERRGALPAA
jgi:hypothetical protein